MPDVNAMLARLRSHVNVTSTTVLPDADILEAVNAAQEYMWQAGSTWRSLDSRFAFDYLASTDGMSLPSGIEKIVNVWQMDTTQSNPSLARTEIPQTTRAAWVDFITTGQPSETFTLPEPALHFYLFDELLYLVPQPSGTTRIEVDYTGAPNELATTGPNVESHFTRHYYRTLYWGALSNIFAFLGQDDRAALAELEFMGRFDRAKAVETTATLLGGKRIRGI